MSLSVEVVTLEAPLVFEAPTTWPTDEASEANMLSAETDVMKGPPVLTLLMLTALTCVPEELAAVAAPVYGDRENCLPEPACLLTMGVEPPQLCHSTLGSLATLAS